MRAGPGATRRRPPCADMARPEGSPRRCERDIRVLERRASPARPRAQAPPEDRAARMAAAAVGAGSGALPPWPDPLGRMPRDEHVHDASAERPRRDVQLSALLLLERVRGHPLDLLRVLRSA